MKTWLGGLERSVDSYYRAMLDAGGMQPLLSFYYTRPQAMITPDQFTFFLDSGAYSAWTMGAKIDIDEYCAFIKANIETIEVYACLDSIPGKIGQIASTAERNAAAELTWKNYLYMRGEGLDPLPVYHYGEDQRFLDRMLEYGCEYIGIGGLVGVPSGSRQVWLDRLFSYLTDDFGMPRIKTHGFGMTAVPLIFRYPWYSVDSTSWIQATANGAIYLPAKEQGQFVFDRTPMTVSVSSKNPKAGANGKAANTMSQSMRAILQEWLDVCGVTYEQVADDYRHRAVCNATFFRKVSELKAVHPFNIKEQVKRASLWN